MDVSSLREKMVQNYQEELKEVIPCDYRHEANEAVLEKLDKAMAVLIVEREFAMVQDSLVMQLGWLKSTATLADILIALCNIQTEKVAAQTIEEMPEEFDKLFRKIIAIYNKRCHASMISRELLEMKEHYLSDLYWDIFRNEDHHSPAVSGEIAQQLSVAMAEVPGTLASRLIEKRCELCDLFPELEIAELEQQFMKYRLDFAMDKNPSEMDDFTSKIIQVVSRVMADESAEELMSEMRNNVTKVLAEARNESFSGVK